MIIKLNEHLIEGSRCGRTRYFHMFVEFEKRPNLIRSLLV